MNQRTVLGVLLVFMVTVFTQCTVQKRLYRKGYYISFHKTPKRTTETHEEKQLIVFSSEDSTKTATMLEPEASQKVLAEIPESVNASSDLVVDESTVSFGVNAALTRVKETTEVVKQVISIDKKAPEPTAKAQPRHARTAIIVTMILLIAAGIGLIFLD